MCDLGTSINVMPMSIYLSLKVGPLHDICVIIQLANKFIIYTERVLEDVIIQVDGLVFPVDFHVLVHRMTIHLT